MKISCSSDGASIGYRKLDKNQQLEKTWSVYKEPIKVDKHFKLEAVAHRLGYQRSEAIFFEAHED